MRIEQPRRRTPYLNQRDQFRMLAMVGLLMLMVFAIRVAARPSSWYWLTGMPGEATQDAPAPEIDFGVDLESNRPLRPDEFFAAVDESDEQRVDEPPAENTPPNEERPQEAAVDVNPPTDPETMPAEVGSPAQPDPAVDPLNIDPDVFSVVKDNTLGVRQQEAGVHDMLLARVRKVPPAEVANAARDDVTFTVLMLEPDRFRGGLLTVRGRVKRVVELPVAPNRFGVERMYEAWILTRDSGTNPYRFVFTELPTGIPLSEGIEADVEVSATGFFFKRYGYATEQGMHVAPLLLGRELQRIEPQQIIPLDTSFTNYIIVGVLAGLAVLMFALWRINRADRSFYEKKLRPLSAPPETSLATLQGRADESAREMFVRMQQEAIPDTSPVTPPTKPGDPPEAGNL